MFLYIIYESIYHTNVWIYWSLNVGLEKKRRTDAAGLCSRSSGLPLMWSCAPILYVWMCACVLFRCQHNHGSRIAFWDFEAKQDWNEARSEVSDIPAESRISAGQTDTKNHYTLGRRDSVWYWKPDGRDPVCAIKSNALDRKTEQLQSNVAITC